MPQDQQVQIAASFFQCVKNHSKIYEILKRVQQNILHEYLGTFSGLPEVAVTKDDVNNQIIFSINHTSGCGSRLKFNLKLIENGFDFSIDGFIPAYSGEDFDPAVHMSCNMSIKNGILPPSSSEKYLEIITGFLTKDIQDVYISAEEYCTVAQKQTDTLSLELKNPQEQQIQACKEFYTFIKNHPKKVEIIQVITGNIAKDPYKNAVVSVKPRWSEIEKSNAICISFTCYKGTSGAYATGKFTFRPNDFELFESYDGTDSYRESEAGMCNGKLKDVRTYFDYEAHRRNERIIQSSTSDDGRLLAEVAKYITQGMFLLKKPEAQSSLESKASVSSHASIQKDLQKIPELTPTPIVSSGKKEEIFLATCSRRLESYLLNFQIYLQTAKIMNLTIEELKSLNLLKDGVLVDKPCVQLHGKIYALQEIIDFNGFNTDTLTYFKAEDVEPGFAIADLSKMLIGRTAAQSPDKNGPSLMYK